MASALGRFLWHIPSKQGRLVTVPFTFTTDGAGEPTLGNDLQDALSVALTEESGSPGEYVLTLGSYKTFLACVAVHNLDTGTVVLTPSGDAAAGKVTLEATEGALLSATVSGVIYVIG